MSEKIVNITLIIDRSGSMESMKKEVIGGINAFFDEQKKLPDSATVTYTQFDNVYEVVYKNSPLSEVPKLTEETFQPRGMTALYDAIGKTLLSINPVNGEAQIVVIMTDGEENSSQEFNQKTVKTIIESSKEKGWQIIFMGANIDAEKVSGALGINKDNTVTYAASASGATASLRSLSTKTSMMRSSYSSGNADWEIAGGSMSDLYNSK